VGLAPVSASKKRKAPPTPPRKKQAQASTKRQKKASGLKKTGRKEQRRDMDVSSSDSSESESNYSSSSSDALASSEEEEETNDPPASWNDKLNLPKASDAPAWGELDASFIVTGKRTRRRSGQVYSNSSAPSSARKKKSPVRKPKPKPKPKAVLAKSSSSKQVSSSSSSSSSSTSSPSSFARLQNPHMQRQQYRQPQQQQQSLVVAPVMEPVSVSTPVEVVPASFCLQIDLITDHRVRVCGQPIRGVLECRVRWRGLTEREDSWVSAHTLLSDPVYMAYATEKQFTGPYKPTQQMQPPAVRQQPPVPTPVTPVPAPRTAASAPNRAKPPVPTFSAPEANNNNLVMDVDGPDEDEEELQGAMVPMSQDITLPMEPPVQRSRPQRNQLFATTEFLFTGFGSRGEHSFDVQQPSLIARIMQQGGVVYSSISERVDSVHKAGGIESAKNVMVVSLVTKRTAKAFMAYAYGLPLMRPDYIEDCLASKKLIDGDTDPEFTKHVHPHGKSSVTGKVIPFRRKSFFRPLPRKVRMCVCAE
jgi:hypothetical protein